MIEDLLSLEDLLLATLDAVFRFRVGQRDAVSAALEAGPLLTKAKGRLQHGEWGNWLHCVGLAPRTASIQGPRGPKQGGLRSAAVSSSE